jgi:hypothetical protein
MPDGATLPYALASLATTVSLMDALLKRGGIDEAFVAAATKEAIAYAQALCVELSPDLERETQRILRSTGREQRGRNPTDGTSAKRATLKAVSGPSNLQNRHLVAEGAKRALGGNDIHRFRTTTRPLYHGLQRTIHFSGQGFTSPPPERGQVPRGTPPKGGADELLTEPKAYLNSGKAFSASAVAPGSTSLLPNCSRRRSMGRAAKG